MKSERLETKREGAVAILLSKSVAGTGPWVYESQRLKF